MKIPFDIKFRPQIESGEYKVETRDGRKARIIHWDLNCTSPIVAVMDAHIDLPGEIVDVFGVSGMAFDDLESPSDLFLITPEPELTEFEATLLSYLSNDTSGELDKETMHKCVKARAKELLDLARKEILKGENIMTISGPGLFSEGETRFTNMPIADALKAEYEKGKAEALKDLPRWKKIRDNGCVDADGDTYTDCLCLLKRGWYQVVTSGTKAGGELQYLSIKDLEKLPGFKEDSQ